MRLPKFRSSMSPTFSFSRRQALAFGAAGLLGPGVFKPSRVLINSMVEGLIMKAQAGVGGTPTAGNLVHLSLGGGPPRWCFDLAMGAYGQASSVMPNPGVGTVFDFASKAVKYRTVPVNVGGRTFSMPALWGSELPTASGGRVPMAGLMNSMIAINGCNMMFDSHSLNNIRNFSPEPGNFDLLGLTGDASNAPLPAIGLPGTQTAWIRGAKGSESVPDFTSSDPLVALLQPFDGSGDNLPSGFMNRRDALDSAVKSALRALGAHAASGVPGADALYSIRNTAETYLKNGFGAVAGQFTNLRNKYLNLIASCAARDISGNPIFPVLGVTDVPLPTSALGSPLLQARISGSAGLLAPGNQDLRTLIGPSTRIANLAEGFAMAEFLIVHKLSSACMIGAGGQTDGLHLENYTTLDPTGSPTGAGPGNSDSINHIFDEHGAGSVASLLVNTFLFHSIAACLNELISQFQAAGVYQDTVIYIGSEFSRAPNEGGSGHGFQAHVSSIFSGKITQPMILGNTYADGSTYGLGGSWGSSAPVLLQGVSRSIGIGNVTSTVAALVGIPAPSPNDSALIEVGSGGVVALIETAKLV